MKYITPKPLTRVDFAKFGEVVSVAGKRSQMINDGYAQKFDNVVSLDANENNGRSALHLYITKKRSFPLSIDILEKHPHFSQTFIPQINSPFVCIVAPPADTPNINDIEAFITDGQQGIHYARGTWHFPLISLVDNAPFVVIDRNPEDDIVACIEYPLTDSQLMLALDSDTLR